VHHGHPLAPPPASFAPAPSAAARAADRVARAAPRAAVALAVLAAGRLLWLSRGWPLVHDAPLLHYVAEELRRGAAPYRDVFDMNFPGVYLAHWLVLATLGPGDAAFRLFDLTVLAVTAGGLFAARATLSPWGAAAAGALFALHHVAGGPWLAGQRDFLLCAPLAWALAGALAAGRTAGLARHRRLAAAAVALGVGAWLKPHALVAAPGLLALAWRDARPGRALGVVGAGLAAPALPVVGWLAARGGLGTFLDLVVGYLVPLYSRLGRSSLVSAVATRDFGVAALAGMCLWSALGTAALLSPARRGALGTLGAGVGYGLVHFAIQGRGWEYHLYPAVLFLVALGGAGLDAALADRRRAIGLALALVLAGTAGALWTKGHRNLDPEWIRLKLARVARLTATLRPVVAAGAAVQVLDTAEGGIHALLRTGARQPTRFLYDFPFYHDVDHPYVQRLRGELLAGLRARPPGAVVLFETGWPTGGYERLDGFPALARWLAAGYRLTEEGDGYRVYRPGPGPGGAPAAASRR